MQADIIEDRIARGKGIAARLIGREHELFRPRGGAGPLSSGNRVMRLCASFDAGGSAYRRAGRYGDALWTGLFDAAYTRPGDYLSGPSGIYFIASQEGLLPVLCVRTSRTLSVGRAAAPGTGTGSYGGVSQASLVPLLQDWPASVLAAGGGGQGYLPTDTKAPYWTVLLPRLPVVLQSSDVVSDDAGRSFTVASAEETELGWRLLVKQAVA